MHIHPNWLRPAVRRCHWCKRAFTHGTARRMYCGDPECDRDRDKARKREEARWRGGRHDVCKRPA